MIDKEDLYAYIFRKMKLNKTLTKELCKLYGTFEAIVDLDCLDLLQNRFSGEDIDNPIYKNLAKIQLAVKEINKKEKVLYEEAKLFYLDLMNKGVKWTHLTKNDYPKRLMDIPDPPVLLFYRGKLPDENKPALAIIGARECSMYGRKVAEMLSKELASQGVQIISGLARGIDGISQQCTVECNGATFGVLGCGVNIVYPPENEKLFNRVLERGGIISEFDYDVKPMKQYFPSRNRIISGLSDIVLVVEARKKSGTWITVTQALEQGREVFAVPGRITDGFSDGCNYLISSGASVALDSDCILEELKRIIQIRGDSVELFNQDNYIFPINDKLENFGDGEDLDETEEPDGNVYE